MPTSVKPQTPAPGPVVSLKNVNQIFGNGTDNQTVALQDIHLDIQAGEFISLIGPSGCGKSTLLRVVGDLIAPTNGDVKVNGKPAPQARLDRDYGMVFQSPVLFEWRSVQHNVELPLEVLKINKAERQRRAKEMLDLVELGKFTQ